MLFMVLVLLIYEHLLRFVLIRKEKWEGEQLPPTRSDNSSGFQQWLPAVASKEAPLGKRTCAPANIHCHSQYEIPRHCSDHCNLSPTYP